MLSGVRLRLIGTTCALVALVAACSSTTNGSGSVRSRGPATSEFPSNVASQPVGSTGTATVSGQPPAPATSATPRSSIHPAPATPIRTVAVQSPDGKVNYVVKVWADVQNPTCYDHAYGKPIITFLTEHPCHGMHRLLATTTVDGRAVGFAETATSFAGTASDPYAYSSKFARLEKQDGTGSINDLLREGYRLASGPSQIPRHEAFNVLSQDNGVTVWDAWYLEGTTPDNAKPLMKMTTDLFLQV